MSFFKSGRCNYIKILTKRKYNSVACHSICPVMHICIRCFSIQDSRHRNVAVA